MDRRRFLQLATAGSAAALATRRGHGMAAPADLYTRWKKLDNLIRTWWDGDLHKADETAVREDEKKTLLFLPFPYSSGGGSQAAFPEIYGWDTQFINLALLAHGRPEIVRWHILNQLSMIDRFGKVLNGNRTYYLGRGQPPLLPWSVKNYLAVKQDDDLAMRAYPSLEREYTEYWDGTDHRTPIGLATAHDSGSNDGLSNEEDAECETGLDFTPIFGGDVRRCVPLHINCALVRYAEVMAQLADRLGWHRQAAEWRGKAGERAERIHRYCWDAEQGFYFEYDFVAQKRLPYYSLNGFWPLWSGIASKQQAARVAENLKRFDQPYGLTFTDRDYPNPHPKYPNLEWAYPESWPPQQIIVEAALRRYGYEKEARAISLRYIGNVVTTWEETGLTWERYNGVSGGHKVPFERADPAPLHGFSSASAVVVGRAAFGKS